MTHLGKQGGKWYLHGSLPAGQEELRLLSQAVAHGFAAWGLTFGSGSCLCWTDTAEKSFFSFSSSQARCSRAALPGRAVPSTHHSPCHSTLSVPSSPTTSPAKFCRGCSDTCLQRPRTQPLLPALPCTNPYKVPSRKTPLEVCIMLVWSLGSFYSPKPILS